MSPLWIVSALVACQGGDDATAPAEDPLDRLIAQVLEPSGIAPDEVVVHEVGHLAPGTDLRPAFAPDGGVADPVPVDELTTLFLVDRNADAGWSHPVDWVFVDDDGDVRAEAHGFYPVVDGAPFVPEWHPSVWGAEWEVTDPDALPDDALPSWDGARGARRAQDADPCDPPKVKVAVTILGTRTRAVRVDEHNWRTMLAGRGYQTIRVAPDAAGEPPSKVDVVQAIREAVALGELEELVIFYGGHGGEDGSWVLGDAALPEGLDTGAAAIRNQRTVGAADLVDALADADVERLTIVALSCYSGQLTGLPQLLKENGLEATDIVVHAAAGDAEVAWVPRDWRQGTTFGRALWDVVVTTLPEEPIPWEGIALPRLTTQTRTHGERQQSPEVGFQERCEPEIALATHPTIGTCWAAWLDQLDPEQFTPSQDYGREVMITGKGFGSATGRVELRQQDGDWVVVPHRFWGPEGIAFNLPMRRDGFPANDRSRGVPEDLEEPADRQDLPGTYLVRVVTAEGRESPPQPVKLEYQVYEQHWTPVVSNGDFPDWVEQWHPLTPEALWTLGPTVQLSVTWAANLEPSPVPQDLTTLDADQDQPHRASPAIAAIGSWHFEIPPSIRNLATAYDQSYPQFQYWGYRVRFDDDGLPEHTWGFALVYD